MFDTIDAYVESGDISGALGAFSSFDVPERVSYLVKRKEFAKVIINNLGEMDLSLLLFSAFDELRNINYKYKVCSREYKELKDGLNDLLCQ